MAGIDDIIGDWVKRAEQSGELEKGRYWGKPFDLEDGFEQTPVRLRMAHRILKNSGYVPAEIEMIRQLAELKEQLAAETAADRRAELSTEIGALTAKVRILLEGAAR
jgi:hypothetical protein